MPFCPKRLPSPQNLPISDTFLSQHFIFFDNRRKIKSTKSTPFGPPSAQPPAVALCAAARHPAPLRGRFAPPLRGATRPARCARTLLRTRKKSHHLAQVWRRVIAVTVHVGREREHLEPRQNQAPVVRARGPSALALSVQAFPSAQRTCRAGARAISRREKDSGRTDGSALRPVPLSVR